MEMLIEDIKDLYYKGEALYQKLKVECLYHSNKIEGIEIRKKELIKYLEEGKVETKYEDGVIQEIVNSLRLFDFVIETLDEPLNKKLIQEFHSLLKQNTRDHECGFSGCWKKIPNYICGSMVQVAQPWEVEGRMNELLKWWSGTLKGAEDIIEFHIKFEHIHPFQDGNGRIGRMIMLKQCIENKLKLMLIHEKYAGEYKMVLYKAQTTGDMSDIISVIKMCERAFREEGWGYECRERRR